MRLLLQHLRRVNNRWRGYEVAYIVEDNVRVHTARDTQAKALQLGMHFNNHPPCSPDLNPIENYWALLKHKLAALPQKPTNLEDLFEVAQRIWTEMDQGMINKMIGSTGR